MTLAEARKLSPQRLAERLLGAAGVGGNYVEAKIWGDGGLMIHMPGLNAIDFYQRPASAGFEGVCSVDGVHIEFSGSRYDTRGDPPHHVTDFWKLKRFAMLAPTDKRLEHADWSREKRDCGKLAPIAGRIDPTFFAVDTDRPVDAYFAMRALAKAQIMATRPGAKLSCKSYDADWSGCADARAALSSIPIRQINYVKVARCPDQAGWCVVATCMKSHDGNQTKEITLTIRTNAAQTDPPTDFDVTSADISAGTSIDD